MSRLGTTAAGRDALPPLAELLAEARRCSLRITCAVGPDRDSRRLPVR